MELPVTCGFFFFLLRARRIESCMAQELTSCMLRPVFFWSVCKSQRASDYHRLRVLREREREYVIEYVLLILVIMLCVFLSDI